jgi:hypothetical protein
MISIWGRYRDNKPEVIDRASDQRQAEYMLGEYMLAFGAYPGQCHHKDWKLWAGRRDAEPQREERNRYG